MKEYPMPSIVQVREEGWTSGMRESGSIDKKEPRADTNKYVPLIPPNTEPPKGRPVPTSKIEVDIVVSRLDLIGSSHGGRLEKLPNYVGMLRDVLWVFGTRAFRFRYSRTIGQVMQSAKERYAVATSSDI
ncbi:hypothetical protein Tco_0871972 [Tanacetum coccineum]